MEEVAGREEWKRGKEKKKTKERGSGREENKMSGRSMEREERRRGGGGMEREGSQGRERWSICNSWEWEAKTGCD